jgi:hypothetical protein
VGGESSTEQNYAGAGQDGGFGGGGAGQHHEAGSGAGYKGGSTPGYQQYNSDGYGRSFVSTTASYTGAHSTPALLTDGSVYIELL